MISIGRRNVLSSVLAAPILALDPKRVAGQTGFDWQQFKGRHIEVFLQKGPRADLLQKHQKEFETLTGVSVGSEQIPEQQQRQKFMIELGSGYPSFDIASVNPAVSKRLLGKSKWFDDLRPYLNDTSLTAPDFDFADFSKPSIDYATQSDGRMDMLMQNLDYQILYWNKEIFAAKGIAYPDTHAELLAAAKALNDPARGIAGMVARGMKNANTPVWTNFLLGYGLNAIDPDLTRHTQSPEAIGAATLYQQLLSAAGPVGVSGYNWYESQGVFLQGRAAMWMDACGFAQPLENSAMSRVVGKVGYGVFPAGPMARVSGLSADALGITAASANKMPAWLYLQWACGKTMMARQLAGGYGAPPRQSAFVAAKVDPAAKLSPAWLDCVISSAGYAHPILPQIVAVTEFRDVFGIALTNMIGGADPASELKKATEAFVPVLQKSEKA
jgi:multiple sugar transport system substrate-binding protein